MRLKLSELTYDILKSAGLTEASMHVDATDVMRCVYNSDQTEAAKRELTERYGDVDLIITPDADWYDRIRIDDQKWREDYEAYCKEKAAWCAKYGSN